MLAVTSVGLKKRNRKNGNLFFGDIPSSFTPPPHYTTPNQYIITYRRLSAKLLFAFHSLWQGKNLSSYAWIRHIWLDRQGVPRTTSQLRFAYIFFYCIMVEMVDLLSVRIIQQHVCPSVTAKHNDIRVSLLSVNRI